MSVHTRIPNSHLWIGYTLHLNIHVYQEYSSTGPVVQLCNVCITGILDAQQPLGCIATNVMWNTSNSRGVVLITKVLSTFNWQWLTISQNSSWAICCWSLRTEKTTRNSSLLQIETKLIYIVLNPAHVPWIGMSTPTKNRDYRFWTKISRHRGAKPFI